MMNSTKKISRGLKPRQRPDYDHTSCDIDEEDDPPAEPRATAIQDAPRREAEPEKRKHPQRPLFETRPERISPLSGLGTEGRPRSKEPESKPRVPIELRSNADGNPDPPGVVARPRTATRKLKDLKSYPDQARYFTDLSDHDLRILVEDIRDHGLKDPIEILPANEAGFPENTILKGHQRKRALESIGKTEVAVLVRHDLAQVDPPTIEREFLNDNLNRRQLDVLGKARVSLRLYEIEKKRPRDQLGKEDEKEARNRVGKAIGMSGRNLDRYFRILRTPPEVQKAFQDGRLRLIDAEKVARLDPARQAQLACEMTGTQDLKALLRSYFPGRNQPPGKAESLSEFLKSFEHGLEGLARHAGPGTLTNKDRASYLEALKKAQSQIEALLAGVSG